MDQRRHRRSEPLSKMQVAWRSDGEYSISVISDLCPSGAFIHTTKPPESGTILHLLLDVPNNKIRTQAIVRRSIPGRGMGIEFQPMSQDNRERFENLLEVAVPLWREASSKGGRRPREHSAAVATLAPASRAKAPEHPKASPASSARTPVTDLRAHRRHKIAAAVEVAEEGTGQLVKGQLVDLARMGCYVKVETCFPVGAAADLTIARNSQSFHAQARVVSAVAGKGMGLTFTRLEPEHSAVLDRWLAASVETSWLSSIRRRSHRILLKLPVQVAGSNSLGAEFSEDTQTISVSADGALILLSAEVAKGQFLTLGNVRTRASLECSVVYVGQIQERRREVGVSFTLPNRTFWQIAFPPLGWSPHSPDAKKT